MIAALFAIILLLVLTNMALIVLIAGEREEAAEERQNLTATIIKLNHGAQATNVYVTGDVPDAKNIPRDLV